MIFGGNRDFKRASNFKVSYYLISVAGFWTRKRSQVPSFGQKGRGFLQWKERPKGKSATIIIHESFVRSFG